ncbi:MAG TPA: acyl-CoA dehydrogenase family protein, partial [Burkholderiaceae bacterium]|nr:acyl-CoA dehydrogenase family protein [Burkholderiaceae bacterium]
MSITVSEFGFTEDQKIMRESVLALLEKTFTPEMIRQHDEDRAFPFGPYAALARNGWLGLPHEAEYGGMDGSYKDLVVIIEAIAQHNAQLASAYLTSVIYGGMQIKHGASPELKAEIMPGVIQGDVRLAICITEPETGSDVASIRTRARKDGDDYLISGQKVYITCAHVAHHIVVAAKTDPDAGHKGITLFLVDVTSPGVNIRPMKALGRRMIHT